MVFLSFTIEENKCDKIEIVVTEFVKCVRARVSLHNFYFRISSNTSIIMVLSEYQKIKILFV